MDVNLPVFGKAGVKTAGFWAPGGCDQFSWLPVGLNKNNRTTQSQLTLSSPHKCIQCLYDGDSRGKLLWERTQNTLEIRESSKLQCPLGILPPLWHHVIPQVFSNQDPLHSVQDTKNHILDRCLLTYVWDNVIFKGFFNSYLFLLSG